MKTREMVLLKKYFVWLLALLLVACEDDPVTKPTISEVNLNSDYLYEIMDYNYLWNDYLPKSVNLNKSPFDLLEDLRYTPLDKWSYISSTEEHKAYYQQGTFEGYGFGFARDSVGNVRVTFVFEKSSLGEKGIKRGWIVEEVDNTTITSVSQLSQLLAGDKSSQTFTLIDIEGNTQQHTFTKQEIEINTVLYNTVLNVGEKKAGYLVFKGFISKSESELRSAFQEFKNAEIDELIVDLRYNGGGLVNTGLLLGGLIGGENVKDQVMVQYIHNSNLSNENKAYTFAYDTNHVNIDRVFFITTRGTASASEMVINGLKPYMEVILVGDDTHGKPAGMYSWSFKDFTVVPITFQIANAMGDGDYFDGIPVDALVKDDVTRSFGDTNEFCLKETLYYIAHDEFSLNADLRSAKPEMEYPRGLRFEIGAY